MTWLNRLEKRYSKFALEGLIRHICILMAVVFFLNKTANLPYSMLTLSKEHIMAGEIWRLFTFLLIPYSSNVFLLLFELLILDMCGSGLEQNWGTFKLNIYYFTGAIANIIVALMLPQVQLGSYYIYLSLFLGFATVYPDYEILLFFILPVKVKYMAMLSGGLMLYNVIFAPIYIKIAIALTIGNYLLFFAPDAIASIGQKKRQYLRNEKFIQSIKSKDYNHKCHTCGKTDVDNDNTQFRYCTCEKCGDNGVAFCLEHLKEHKSQDKYPSPAV